MIQLKKSMDALSTRPVVYEVYRWFCNITVDHKGTDMASISFACMKRTARSNTMRTFA